MLFNPFSAASDVVPPTTEKNRCFRLQKYKNTPKVSPDYDIGFGAKLNAQKQRKGSMMKASGQSGLFNLTVVKQRFILETDF
jgi:hypothetical protein